MAPATALAVALTVLTAGAAHAAPIPPPNVPASIAVPAGNKVAFVGHAIGTQDYVCAPKGTGVEWKLVTPQATLFNGDKKQTMTHFFSPNPWELGTVRPTWLSSKDSSLVWAVLHVPASNDPAYVAPGSLTWLLLRVYGTQAGPDGGDSMTSVTYIHRVNTVGGTAPTYGCGTVADLGETKFVPYEADYYFYIAE